MKTILEPVVRGRTSHEERIRLYVVVRVVQNGVERYVPLRARIWNARGLHNARAR